VGGSNDRFSDRAPALFIAAMTFWVWRRRAAGK
jgi:hypothetical protein